MFLSRNKKNNVYPCKPQFYYIKVGFKGSKLYRYVFVMIQRRKNVNVMYWVDLTLVGRCINVMCLLGRNEVLCSSKKK